MENDNNNYIIILFLFLIVFLVALVVLTDTEKGKPLFSWEKNNKYSECIPPQ